MEISTKNTTVEAKIPAKIEINGKEFTNKQVQSPTTAGGRDNWVLRSAGEYISYEVRENVLMVINVNFEADILNGAKMQHRSPGFGEALRQIAHTRDLTIDFTQYTSRFWELGINYSDILRTAPHRSRSLEPNAKRMPPVRRAPALLER